MEDLSKGMSQETAVCVTVLHEPSLIILDEPFEWPGPCQCQPDQNEIFALAAKGKYDHLQYNRMEQVEEICDHIALINKANRSSLVRYSRLQQFKGKHIPHRCEHTARTPDDTGLPGGETQSEMKCC